MATSLSPLSKSISFTPCVLRPAVRISLHGVRTVWPWAVLSMISSASVTVRAPTTLPTLSVVLMVMMPLPPLFWTRYSSNGVRYANAVFAGHQQRGVRVDNLNADDVIAFVGTD